MEIDGETITCTPGHKFFLPLNKNKRDLGQKQEHESYYGLSDKWVSAKDLKPGDIVLLESGKYGKIGSVTMQELDTPEVTYNFEVADYHTYYVGEKGILTHNAGCDVDFPENATSQNQMQRQVVKDQAPKGIERVDPPHVGPNAKFHIHFGDNYKALNWDGTWHDIGKATPSLTKDITNWITNNGWRLPK